PKDDIRSVNWCVLKHRASTAADMSRFGLERRRKTLEHPADRLIDLPFQPDLIIDHPFHTVLSPATLDDLVGAGIDDIQHERALFECRYSRFAVVVAVAIVSVHSSHVEALTDIGVKVNQQIR